jgi:RNA polymerase sigma-54 factor
MRYAQLPGPVRVLPLFLRPIRPGGFVQPSLQLRAAQQLALTPQLVQAIRLLQLSAADLEHELQEALARNPFLERVGAGADEGGAQIAAPAAAASTADAADTGAGAAVPAGGDDDGTDASEAPWTGSARHDVDGDHAFTDDCAAQPSLREHLREQLAGSRFDAVGRDLVETVIDALDEDGYLRQSAADLIRVLPASSGVTTDDVEVAVRFVQSLDPAGVAARSLAECLEVQLRHLAADRCGDETIRALALRIVRERLDVLALHDAPRLAQELGADADAVRRANVLIRGLDPRPGSAFGRAHAPYVIADVIVRRVGGRWIAAINPQAVPGLRIDRTYADIVQRSREVPGSLARCLQEARWLIRGVEQRFDTIRRVAQAIVERQSRYFELGELALRPLALRDVARELGLHPSTVSRVANNKYAQTPVGLVELKRFFSNRASTRPGTGNCSAAAMRTLIRELVAAEDPRAPLSDVQIARLLASRGIPVARRTVAKYRAAIGVPAVESRRMAIAGEVTHRTTARPIAALAREVRAKNRPHAAHPATEATPEPQEAASRAPSLPYSLRRL